MSVWRRPVRSTQMMGGVPWIPVSRSGYADIDGSRVDTALQSVAVGAAVDLIASLASELPVTAYRGTGPDRVKLRLPPYLEDPAGDGTGRQDWCYQVLVSWLLRGNVYGAVLERAPGRGHLTQVDLFHPDMVSGYLSEGRPVWQVAGQQVDQATFLHRRVNPVPGQVLGLSPIAYRASTIGVSLASTQFGADWFRDGAHPTGILGNSEVELDAGVAKAAKARFLAALRGTREPLVLGKGWSWSQIQINPEESQFLETMGWSESQCARIFGPGIAEILGYAVKGASMTYSNLADRDLHLLKYTLDKWLRRLERLLSEFLPRPQYVVIDRDALLETSTIQRYAAHASALSQQWKTINEVRQLEHLDPVPWGDVPAGVTGAAPADQEEPGGPGPDAQEEE